MSCTSCNNKGHAKLFICKTALNLIHSDDAAGSNKIIKILKNENMGEMDILYTALEGILLKYPEIKEDFKMKGISLEIRAKENVNKSSPIGNDK